MNEKKLNKIKGITRKVLIGNTILLVILALAFMVMFTINARREKVIIDGVEMKMNNSVVIHKKGVKYINLKELFGTMNLYKVNNGVYGATYESAGSFYIESPYEAVQLTNGTRTMYKSIKLDYQDRLFDKKEGKLVLTEEEKKQNKQVPEPRKKTPIDSAIISREEFKLENPVYKDGANVLVALEDLKYILNVKIIQKGADIHIVTIDELEKRLARFLKQENLSLNPLYQNRKAIIDDYFIATTNENATGVYERKPETGVVDNKIGVQYEEIRYIQSEKGIYFTTKDRKLGLKSLVGEGKDIIKAGDYDAINIYYKEEGLYLVEKNEKFGLINNLGDTIVPIEYHQIGLMETIKPKSNKKIDEDEDEKNKKDSKIIMDKFIPVMRKTTSKGDMWRLFLKNGKASTDLKYVNIGYKVPIYVEPNQSGRVEIPEEKRELASKLNISSYDLTTESLKDLKRLGITTDKNNVIDGAEDLIYIPEGYKDSGVVVEVYDPTEKINVSKYGIIRADFSPETVGDPFVYPPSADRIFKEVKDGNTHYYAEIGNIQEEFVTGEEGRVVRKVDRENQQFINIDEERRRQEERRKQQEKDQENQEEIDDPSPNNEYDLD